MYNHVLSTNRIFVVNILLNGALQHSMQPYLRFQGEGEQSKQSPVRSHCKEPAASVWCSLSSVLHWSVAPQEVSHAHVYPKDSEWHQPWVVFTKQLCKNRRINNFALKGGTAYVGMHWDVETETLANEHPFCVPAYKRHRKPADRGLVQHVWHPSLKMELLYIYRFS